MIHTLIEWNRAENFRKQQYASPVICPKKQKLNFELNNGTM